MGSSKYLSLSNFKFPNFIVLIKDMKTAQRAGLHSRLSGTVPSIFKNPGGFRTALMVKTILALMLSSLILATLPACAKKQNAIYSRHKNKKIETTKAKAETDTDSISKMLGIISEPVRYVHMTQNIRLPGKISSDADLYNAQQEYISAQQNGESNILESAKLRLKILGYSQSDLDRLITIGKPDKDLIYPDNTAWVTAEVYEMDIGKVHKGQSVSLTSQAYPGRTFEGTVRYIEGTINPMSRSAKVRISLPNQGQALKLEMYMNIEVHSILGAQLAVPKSALIDTGERKVVYVDIGGGKFKMTHVTPGFQSDDSVQILSGIKEGDKVVIKGNFMLDSQSTLSGGQEIIDQSGGNSGGGGGMAGMPGM